MKKSKIQIRQIGTVHKTSGSSIKKIEIFPEYSEGLDGLKNLNEIEVYYWMHQLKEKDREILKVHPKGDPVRPLTGVFALRSPKRPNPIGETRVKIHKIEDNRILVKGLDAFDGSPVIDIKHCRE